MKKFINIQWAFALIILIALSGCASIYENGKELASDTKPYIEEITVDELNAKIENSEEFFLIDVRQPAEFEKGNLPYSTLLPRGIIEFKIGDKAFWEDDQQWFVPEKDAEIVIYCKKGDRGILATKSLMELGYSNVRNLEGGIIAWDPEFDSGSEAAEEGGCGG